MWSKNFEQVNKVIKNRLLYCIEKRMSNKIFFFGTQCDMPIFHIDNIILIKFQMTSKSQLILLYATRINLSKRSKYLYFIEHQKVLKNNSYNTFYMEGHIFRI